MFRVDGGDGPRGSHSPYYSARSTNKAQSWTRPQIVPGTGAVRPRLALIGPGGPLVLGGGRALNLHTRDVLLWVSADGMGTSWQRYSISYWHNRLTKNVSDHFTPNVNSTDPKHPGGGGAETTGVRRTAVSFCRASVSLTGVCHAVHDGAVVGWEERGDHV